MMLNVVAISPTCISICAVVKRPVGLLRTHFHEEELKIDWMNVAATIGPDSHTQIHTCAGMLLVT